ncbi:MAG: DNA polymerase III subunit beta [Candidatus Colwellbacteria bacterium]|nr:DNA polymerase III subunit beta [Candidatus Colwellbacteria bacterium]
MRYTALRENLQKALLIASRIVAKNPSLPILETVLIETENKQLKISATNLELGMHAWVKGKIDQEGKLCVPVSLLGNIVSTIQEERITLEGKGLNMEIIAQSFQGTIKGQDPNDFPIIPQPGIKTFIEMSAKKLAEGLSQVVPLATISEIYPEISGVFFSFSTKGITLAATDSFRLGKKEVLERVPKELLGLSFILPLRSSQEFLHILEQYPGEVLNLGASENQAVFSLNDVYVISRLLSGNYPNYQELIPKDFLLKVSVDRLECIEKVKLASIFAPKTNECKIEIGASSLKISADAALGSSQATLKAKVQGAGVSEITFNYRYLLDGLTHMRTKEVVFNIKNEATPVLFTGAGDESYLYLAAPLKS